MASIGLLVSVRENGGEPVSAVERDNCIEAEGNALDGVATYKQGPLPDSRLYTTQDGRHVILYRRVGNQVEIERVMPSISRWNSEP